jgi:glycosyltransferase involved in cell wall biosynthesis
MRQKDPDHLADTIELVPLNDLQPNGDAWIATGDNPHFLLRPRSGRQPSGWSRLRFRMESDAAHLSPVLYVDDGAGFSETDARRISVREAAGRGVLLRLPGEVRALRLDPLRMRGRFRIEGLGIEHVGRTHAVLLRLAPVVARLAREPGMARRYVASAVQVARQSGLRGLLRHALRDRNPSDEKYADWVRAFDTLNADDRTAIAARIAAMDNRPTISVVVPLYNTPERLLRRCIDSVRAQLWPDWELCLADDASPALHVQTICEQYARDDQRIRFTRRAQNGHIAAASNTALSLASGEFVAMLDHDDELAPHALYMVAEALNERPDLDLIFSDEDKIDDAGTRREPWFKSDWNYDLMLSQNAVVHLAVFRRRLIEEVGGFRSDFDGSQDYDLTMRVAERTTPDRIHHIPFVLYHWRAIPGSVALGVGEKEYPYEAAARVLEEHLERTGRAGARVERQDHPGYYHIQWPLPPDPPQVAIIIPTRDKVELLRVAVGSVLDRTDYPSFEIIIVDNGSVEAQTLQYLHEAATIRNVRILRYDQPYNFAALNNWAVAQTDAPLIGFLNNDVEVITPGWLSEMASHALRPEVGAVGCKLYFPNGTIQHAGIVVGIGGRAGHPHWGYRRGSLGYFGRAACVQRFSAVTAACMVMRRDVFLRFGGFNEHDFAIAFNDVDLGLRLNRAGLAVIWTPHAELFHHESASLGTPTSDSRQQQFKQECANLTRCWPEAIKNDPFYNPNLTNIGGDWSVAIPPRVIRPWWK